MTLWKLDLLTLFGELTRDFFLQLFCEYLSPGANSFPKQKKAHPAPGCSEPVFSYIWESSLRDEPAQARYRPQTPKNKGIKVTPLDLIGKKGNNKS